MFAHKPNRTKSILGVGKWKKILEKNKFDTKLVPVRRCCFFVGLQIAVAWIINYQMLHHRMLNEIFRNWKKTTQAYKRKTI